VLGESEKAGIKGYGYGSPVLIDYETDGKQERAVLHTISPGPFGHEHMADRAQILLWEHKTFNGLPRHVRSIDIGAFRRDGGALSGLRFARTLLTEIEHQSVDWRWRLKDRVHRLRQVHGDFHPWNILFRENEDFTVLDRSRGEWGEPADDVTSLTMNFLFFSLQGSGRLDGNFESLFKRFWERYLTKSGDVEMLQVSAPFFAFRGLVMAHPIWYPNLSKDVRQKLFNFIRNVMSDEFFNPDEV